MREQRKTEVVVLVAAGWLNKNAFLPLLLVDAPGDKFSCAFVVVNINITGPPFQLITTNLASIVFALLVIILNRMWKTPYHKAMIGASLFLTYLQLMSAMMYGGICQLNVSIYIEQVLYAAQASTGDVCRVNDCENQLMSQISGIVQGILSLKNQPNEVLAVVISVFSFLTHVVASVMLITREKAAASESDDVTTPPTSDQVPTTTQADRPKMDYSDL